MKLIFHWQKLRLTQRMGDLRTTCANRKGWLLQAEIPFAACRGCCLPPHKINAFVCPVLPDKIRSPGFVEGVSGLPFQPALPFPVLVAFHPNWSGPWTGHKGDGSLRHSLGPMHKGDLWGEGVGRGAVNKDQRWSEEAPDALWKNDKVGFGTEMGQVCSNSPSKKRHPKSQRMHPLPQNSSISGGEKRTHTKRRFSHEMQHGLE